MAGHTLFDTPLGRCGIAWSDHGLLAVQLPEASDAATRARLRRRLPLDAAAPEPPPQIAEAIARIVALLNGTHDDLRSIALDLDGVPDFDGRVYAVARAIAPGDTLTYGEVAARLGEPDAARAVGAALGRNPFTLVVPCHRVLAAQGAYSNLGGFSAPGGTATKRRLLTIEGAAAVASLFAEDA
jgi:methylated-DNA-[protein]-cysteine S-methyltransferase